MVSQQDIPTRSEPSRETRAEDGALEALLAGVSIGEIARATGGSMPALLRHLGRETVRGEVRELCAGADALLRLRLAGLKMSAMDTLGRLAAAESCEATGLTADQARAMEVSRRACISIVRLELNAKEPGSRPRERWDDPGRPRGERMPDAMLSAPAWMRDERESVRAATVRERMEDDPNRAAIVREHVEGGPIRAATVKKRLEHEAIRAATVRERLEHRAAMRQETARAMESGHASQGDRPHLSAPHHRRGSEQPCRTSESPGGNAEYLAVVGHPP